MPSTPSRVLLTTWRTLKGLRRKRAKRSNAPRVVSLQEAYLPIDGIDADALRTRGGLRVLWRVWGLDLCRIDPDDQAQWLATYGRFLTATSGWQAQWRASSYRSRMEEHLGHTEATLARGEIGPQLEAIARERIADRRAFVESAFLTEPVFYFVVPGDDPDQLEERATLVEGWFDQLELTYVRQNFFDQATLLAREYGAGPLEEAALERFFDRPLEAIVTGRVRIRRVEPDPEHRVLPAPAAKEGRP